MILDNLVDSKVVVDEMFDVIHEIKNSIAVCCGYLDIISSSKDINDKYISIMRNEFDRSIGIINDFMLYKKVVVKKEIIDIALLLNDLCSEISLYVESVGINFEKMLIDEEIYINGDYDKLKQVFINLIKNSVESIDGNNGNIFVKSYVDSNYFYVIIRDNGSGMTDEVLEKIKNIKFSTKVNGNGIGVYFSNNIICKHDGEILYDSKVGFGTDVIVSLPVSVI